MELKDYLQKLIETAKRMGKYNNSVFNFENNLTQGAWWI